MLILGEILIIITNNLLNVSTFMMVLSTITMFFAVFGLVSLGVGLGAMYPKFKYENIAQVAADKNWGLYELRPEQKTLEQVFVELTSGEVIPDEADAEANKNESNGATAA